MAGEEVKLLGYWASPYALRARIALKLKAISYEYMEEDLGSKSELLLQSNPIYKKVPVLFHDDRAICDSPIIIEYIDTVWNTPDSPPILPLDPYDRAVAKFWGVFIDDKLYSAFRWTIGGLTEAVRVANVEELHSVLQVLETALGKYGEGKRFFGGDSLGYVDIVLGSALGWIKTAEILTEVKFLDEEKTPLLLTWAERFCAHSAVKGLMPETEKLVQLSPFVKLSWKSKTEASIVAAGDFFWVDKEIGDNAYEASSTDNVLIHKKEVNMVSKLKSMKIDNDKIDMNTMRKKKFKSTHLEDGWDDNLIHDDELESLASEKSNKKSTTYKKKMKSVITLPKFIISKKKSSYVNGEEQIDHRHHQTPLPIKDCSIDSDWEVL